MSKVISMLDLARQEWPKVLLKFKQEVAELKRSANLSDERINSLDNIITAASADNISDTWEAISDYMIDYVTDEQMFFESPINDFYDVVQILNSPGLFKDVNVVQ